MTPLEHIIVVVGLLMLALVIYWLGFRAGKAHGTDREHRRLAGVLERARKGATL